MLSQAENICHCIREARRIFWYRHRLEEYVFEDHTAGAWNISAVNEIVVVLGDVGGQVSRAPGFSATYTTYNTWLSSSLWRLDSIPPV